MRRAAFFDLDGTLLCKPSSELRFLRHLWQRGYLGPRQIACGLAYYPAWVLRQGADVGRKNKAFLAGLGHREMAELACAWVEENFESLLQQDICAEVEQCRRSGHRLVLMTGAPDFLADCFASRLKMDHCISTLCHLRGGRFTALPPVRHPLARVKLQLAEDWCAGEGIDLKACTAYGDSQQDFHLLSAVGRAVAVNPDRRMTRLATLRNWQVINTAPVPGRSARPRGAPAMRAPRREQPRS